LKATVILAITLGLLGLEAKIGPLHSEHIITSFPGAEELLNCKVIWGRCFCKTGGVWSGKSEAGGRLI